MQETWLHNFRDPARGVWYPEPRGHGPGHAEMAWWVLDRFDAPATQPLLPWLTAADRRNVETLLLDAEDLSAIDEEHVERFHSASLGRQVTLILTLTPPRHRWPSVWQELVKHGATFSQVDGREVVTRSARLLRGSLRRIIDLFGVRDAHVRLVRREPWEPDLPADLLRLVGVPTDGLAAPPEGAWTNPSIGEIEAHLLRALNELHPGGIDAAPGRALVDALKADQGWRGDLPFRPVQLDERLHLYVRDLAHEEALTLEAMRDEGVVQLHDPHALLATWYCDTDTQPEGEAGARVLVDAG